MKAILVLAVVAIVIVLVISAQGQPGGQCGGQFIENTVGHATECAYKSVMNALGNGFVVDGDEPIFTIVGLIVLAGLLGLLGSTRPTKAVMPYNSGHYRYNNGNSNPGNARRSKNW